MSYFTSLMQECWDSDPNERPNFAEIFKQIREVMEVDIVATNRVVTEFVTPASINKSS